MFVTVSVINRDYSRWEVLHTLGRKLTFWKRGAFSRRNSLFIRLLPSTKQSVWNIHLCPFWGRRHYSPFYLWLYQNDWSVSSNNTPLINCILTVHYFVGPLNHWETLKWNTQGVLRNKPKLLLVLLWHDVLHWSLKIFIFLNFLENLSDTVQWDCSVEIFAGSILSLGIEHWIFHKAGIILKSIGVFFCDINRRIWKFENSCLRKPLNLTLAFLACFLLFLINIPNALPEKNCLVYFRIRFQ